MRRLGALCALLAALAGGAPAAAQDFMLEFAESVTIADREIPFELDMVLRPAEPTRLDAEALIDLRRTQAQLSEALSGTVLLELCGFEAVLQEFEAGGEESIVALTGTLVAQIFVCDRLDPTTFRRGELRSEGLFDLAAGATAFLTEQCIQFQITELTLESFNDAPLKPETRQTIDTTIPLLVEAANVVLADRKLCPRLPAPIASLDPRYLEGRPQEIGDGGLGVFVSGNIDVSTGTILDILEVLQNGGVLPPAP